MSTIKDITFNKKYRRKECNLIVIPNHTKTIVTESQRRIQIINFHKREKYENCGKSRRKLRNR